MAQSANILIPTHEFQPRIGGIGVYLEELARAAHGLGHAVRVVAPSGSGAENFPFSVKRVAMRGSQDWPCRLRMMRYLRDAKEINWPETTLILGEPGPLRLWLHRGWLKLKTPGRLVLVLHGSEIGLIAKMPHRRAMFRSLLEEAELIGVVSSYVERLLLKYFPSAAGKVVRVPGAVRSAWRNMEAGQPVRENGKATFLQVGRIHPRKGQLQLIQAASLLAPAQRESLRLRFVGPTSKPKYLAELRRFAGESSVEISFSGELIEEELIKAYRAAYAVVMPSQVSGKSVEGLGLALLEGGHFGLPVLGTRNGGIPDAVMEGETGFLSEPGNPAHLASVIARLLSDEQLARDLGRNGSRFVRKNFNWGANVRKLLGET